MIDLKNRIAKLDLDVETPNGTVHIPAGLPLYGAFLKADYRTVRFAPNTKPWCEMSIENGMLSLKTFRYIHAFSLAFRRTTCSKTIP
jgi:hypothetical protein